MNFSENPIIVFYEVTRACLLTCKHCRASAQKKRNPLELNLDEIEKLAKDLSKFNNPKPMVIITGGDPLMREDIFQILDIFNKENFSLSISFSGTKLATPEKLDLISKKVKNVAISIDGSNEKIHDNFRNVNGTFKTSIEILNYLQGKVNLQVNTTVGKHNLMDLPNILRLVQSFNIKTWDLFFIVPTGRATSELSLNSDEIIQVMSWLYYVQSSMDFRIKVTEAPFYNRVKMEGPKDNGEIFNYLMKNSDIKMIKKMLPVTKDSKNLGVTDGRGTIFISHIGEIQPTGFLPIIAGNVRKDNIVDVYIKSPVFRDLKDPYLLKGKCGKCNFREICGGSRARAFAIYSDYLQEDPACPF
ncbi:MAG: TIGR04053 family radical SAM/SPASM domain-containing protein [Thermoplasmata archaeon]|nr:TIGR04053 family radical SAM/SPASM domain-containing protein [Thermoplasmata archaeon]